MPECPSSYVGTHDWRGSGLYVTAPANYQEPEYYPPSKLVELEECENCGMLRRPSGDNEA